MNHLWSRAAFSAGNTRSITIQTNLERHITEVFLFNNDMWKILFQPSFQVRQSLGIQMSVINDDILTGFQSLRHTLKTEFTNLILKFRCPCGMVKSSTIQFLSDVNTRSITIQTNLERHITEVFLDRNAARVARGERGTTPE